jgi:hypothetical protein
MPVLHAAEEHMALLDRLVVLGRIRLHVLSGDAVAVLGEVFQRRLGGRARRACFACGREGSSGAASGRQAHYRPYRPDDR